LKLKLDAKTIAGLALAKGRSEDFAWDTEIEGFGLRLRRSGDGLRRTYVAQYRVGARRSRRVTLGTADKLTPAQAREAARKILARVQLGHDPQGDKQAKREEAAYTFKAVVADYLAARQPELRPASHRVTKLYLTGSYFKPLHTMPISTIKRSDLAGCIRNIVRTHSTSTAGAARRALSAFFAWSIAEGLLGDGANPVEGSHRPDERGQRNRVLTDLELVAVWRACGDDDYGRIVRLLALLGSRRQEVGGMRWSEIDLEAGTWTLPAERAKNHRAHTITLPAPALEIIKSVPRGDRDTIFGDAADGFSGWAYAKADLDGRLAGAAVKPWRLHDLRRTTATGMINLGVEPHHVEAVLNHHGGHRAGVAGTYNRSSYEPQIKTALARWSEHVLALVEGREDKVIALRA